MDERINPDYMDGYCKYCGCEMPDDNPKNVCIDCNEEQQADFNED